MHTRTQAKEPATPDQTLLVLLAQTGDRTALEQLLRDAYCSETLFGSLKVERLHGQRFETIREAKDEVLAWLLWYNRTRMHSTLNYVSPVQFEQDWMEATVKIAA